MPEFMGIENLPVRFFAWDEDAETDSGEYGDIVECNESTFLEAVADGLAISYDRHTIRENGVSQICLTAAPRG